MAITLVPELDPAQAQPQPGGAKGRYDLSFILGIPGRETHEMSIDIDAFATTGDSLLVFGPSVERTSISVTSPETGEQVEIELTCNTERRLARAAISVEASSFLDAERVAHNLVMPLLSWLAFRFDTAIEAVGSVTTERATGSRAVRLGVIGQAQFLRFDGGISTPVFRTVLSAYREGLNTSNAFYRVLSFWKVIEGTRQVRSTRRRQAGADMRTPTNERLPSSFADEAKWSVDETSALSPYAGKKFGDVLAAMEPAYRDAVAHLDPERDVLLQDRFDDLLRAEKAGIVLRLMSRVMLANEMGADPVMRLRPPQIETPF